MSEPEPWSKTEGGWVRVLRGPLLGELRYAVTIKQDGAVYRVSAGEVVPGAGLMDLRGHAETANLDAALEAGDGLLAFLAAEDSDL